MWLNAHMPERPQVANYDLDTGSIKSAEENVSGVLMSMYEYLSNRKLVLCSLVRSTGSRLVCMGGGLWWAEDKAFPEWLAALPVFLSSAF